MAVYFDTFIKQCNREQLLHFTICELDIYELMDLVSTEVKIEEVIHSQSGIIEKALNNWDLFQEDITNKILERIVTIGNDKLILALSNLDVNRQNAIMEDDYEWQLKE